MAPAKEVKTNGKDTQIHSGLNTNKASINTLLAKKIIQSRRLFAWYSSFFFIAQGLFTTNAKVSQNQLRKPRIFRLISILS